MGHLGIEPRTYQLKAEYSTIELVTLICRINYKEIIKFYAKLIISLSVLNDEQKTKPKLQ